LYHHFEARREKRIGRTVWQQTDATNYRSNAKRLHAARVLPFVASISAK